MTPFKRIVRNVGERLRGVFYEGPQPPARLEEMVIMFANMNPNATRADWAKFAARHAFEAYRSGYVRGFEWAERDLESRDPLIEPEKAMVAMGHDWDWLDEPVTLENPDALVGDIDGRDPLQEQSEQFHTQEAQERQYRLGGGRYGRGRY